MNYLISFISALFISFTEKTGIFSVFYLTLLPFVIFSGQTPLLLLLSLVLGCVLFLLFQKPTFIKLCIFLVILLISFIIIKPRLGLDMGLLNSINAQKGEHPQYQTSLVAKLIHNKLELVHSYITNFDKLLSPSAIFASGFWHKISPYYPLGFLFPWDLYFIYRYFRNRQDHFQKWAWYFFAPALLLLLLLSGLVYLDQALVFAFAVIYFLALLASIGYSGCSVKTRLAFVLINLFFLFYQLNITSYFKI
jgi:hypothetical protein